jgi:hypothetical protein
MIETWRILIASAALIALGGCQGGKPLDSKDAQGRVDAALQIGNPSTRDEALATSCRDAAKLGASKAVIKGIAAIGNPSTRDSVAEECALSLRDAGQRESAVEVAKLIGNPSTRDSAMKKLASN